MLNRFRRALKVGKRPPVIIADPRVGPEQDIGVTFAKGEEFAPGKHRVVMLHSLWQNYPANGMQLWEFLSTISDGYPARFVDWQLRLAKLERRPIRDVELPKTWYAVARNAKIMSARIPVKELSLIRGLFDSVRVRANWIFEFVLERDTTEMQGARTREYGFQLLADAAERRQILVMHDTDDDCLECILPFSNSTDAVIVKLLELGLATRPSRSSKPTLSREGTVSVSMVTHEKRHTRRPLTVGATSASDTATP
jgi:hypothetical protein